MSKKSFFFYDLETSGLDPRRQRIMQFAGQRTDIDLNPIGEPYNFLVKLSEDILPEPQAILVTKTTPQKTLEEGISEPEFAKLLSEEIFTEDTIALGFNTVRFDDEFIRHCLWRNFYDPYEWAYKDGRGRWDILDLVRMTRALRPDGIVWPVDGKGNPTNRLELLSEANELTHDHAHDALSDVEATIGVTRLIKEKQPKLFEWLFSIRGKQDIQKLVNLEDPQVFVYSSGRYGKDNNFTTVAFPIAPGTRPSTVLVYDLRVDPRLFENLSPQEITKRLQASYKERQAEEFISIPVKELAYNKCPAVAPLGVIDEASWERIGLSKEIVEANLKVLHSLPSFGQTVLAGFEGRPDYPKQADVEAQLYDSFIDNSDKIRMSAVRAADAKGLADFHPDFVDGRFPELLLRYKARHFPKSLSLDEQQAWESYRREKFNENAPKYVKALEQLAKEYEGQSDVAFLLEELQLWLENTAPTDA